MPLYEYRCESCGHEIEHLQKLNDNDLVTCPECDNDTLKRLISASNFTLHGNGWYKKGFNAKRTGPKGLSGKSYKKKE